MESVPAHWEFDVAYDAVDRGCGDFILDLRTEMRRLAAGETILVASRDAGAPVEIPAWCRLTGHRLIDAHPPYFLVRKRNA